MQEKVDLTKLILTMKQNLKNVRKVFLHQVKEGVEQQNQLSRVLQSQASIQSSNQSLNHSFVEGNSVLDLNVASQHQPSAPNLAAPVHYDSSDDDLNLTSLRNANMQSS